jgi:hypothetical protein
MYHHIQFYAIEPLETDLRTAEKNEAGKEGRLT